jgi:hypothetical protein
MVRKAAIGYERIITMIKRHGATIATSNAYVFPIAADIENNATIFKRRAG